MRNKIISDIQDNYTDSMTLSDFCETVDYSRSKILYRFDGWTNAKVVAGVEDANVCPNCGNYFSRLSVHWNKCGEPNISDERIELIIGAVMSDATVSEDGSVTIYNSNKEFLEWIDERLGFMSYGVYLNDKGDDRHKRNIKSGFDIDRDADYKNVYRLKCPVHSKTKELRKLYSDGNKILKNIELTPNILKVWYSGDGGLNWSGDKYAYPEIRAISQSSHDKELSEMFNKFDLDVKVSNGNIRFYGDADKFLSLISPPPSGMEYKWENKDRDRYNKLK